MGCMEDTSSHTDHRNLPEAFVQRMSERRGVDLVEKLIPALDKNPITAVRLNRYKLTTAPFTNAEAIPWHPDGYFLSERPSFIQDPFIHGGAYYVQEPASMLLYQLLDASQPQLILDLCAAPGGKSTLLAAAMHPQSILVANEVIRSRTPILDENLIKWGFLHKVVTQLDPQKFGNYPEKFDLILVDAPCSGEGLFRKTPACRIDWSPDLVLHCAARQKRILADVIPALKVGGRLIYSTCTFAEEENEQVVAWLLEHYENQLEIDLEADLGLFGAIAAYGREGRRVGWHCYPSHFSGEGFFITRIRKKSSTEVPGSPPIFNQQNRDRASKKYDKKLLEAFLYQYTILKDKKEVIVDGENIFYYGKRLQEALHTLTNLRSYSKGLYLGKIRHKEITPSHDLVLSPLINTAVPSMELDLKEALLYLSKSDQIAKRGNTGWIRATYHGINIGWIKETGSKIKNHYPMKWRIKHSRFSK